MENIDFRSYLEPDEYIVWQGKPQKGNYFRPQDMFTVPFGLFFFIFACVWATGAAVASPFFAIFAIPFMGVGLYLSFGMIIHRNVLLGKTYYAITNKKLIRIAGSKIDIVYGKQINNMQITMNKDGTGNIMFLRQEVYYRGASQQMSYPSAIMGFHSLENIKDVIYVQQKINEMEK